jgi:uncharacterized protein YdiU (UPF0061 family)
MKKLGTLQFNNDFVDYFDGDDIENNRPRQTPGMLYSRAAPTQVKKVTLLGWSEALARELEIEKPGETDIDILGGNYVSPSMKPYAACYAGHQFGNWAGQLGDGRAITLGELQTSGGKSWELQLKGAGMTAYSRRADGRAVLRSSVREYLMSEAMYYLGVPTTRALSLVTTGDRVMRDMFYDGNPEFETGAIVMRVSPSFLRFGNYEMLASRDEIENLGKLVRWTIDRYFPHITGENKILSWFKEVVDRTAGLIVEWLRVGFVHGVMNTDNMSILGLTIDYGPYSFLDNYDPNFTPNTTDLPGRRYAFGRQASVAKWNLGCLGGAIAPLLPDTTELVQILDSYDNNFWSRYYLMMANKLGLDEVREGDSTMFRDIEKTLHLTQADMTLFYQLLIDLPLSSDDVEGVFEHFRECFYKELSPEELDAFGSVIKAYINRVRTNTTAREDSIRRMRESNPRFILRNYLLHEAIQGLENGNDQLFRNLQEAIKVPYSNLFDQYFKKRPSWATQKAGCSMLSCSS